MPPSSSPPSPQARRLFWWEWVMANGLAEFLGLGLVAAASWLLLHGTPLGGARGMPALLARDVLLLALGALEGLVVGVAQRRVLRRRWPRARLRGWVGATVAGATMAWALGLLPSTVLELRNDAGVAPPQIGQAAQLLLAAGLGLVGGPVLAFFQWLRLRHLVARGALWWLPAHALAWLLAMPLVFLGAHAASLLSSPVLVAFAAAASTMAAGALVGAVHGTVLVRLAFRRDGAAAAAPAPAPAGAALR